MNFFLCQGKYPESERWERVRLLSFLPLCSTGWFHIKASDMLGSQTGSQAQNSTELDTERFQSGERGFLFTCQVTHNLLSKAQVALGCFYKTYAGAWEPCRQHFRSLGACRSLMSQPRYLYLGSVISRPG